MSEIKNDPKSYIRREAAGPKGALVRKASDGRFFTAPVGPGHYLDLQSKVKPASPRKK